MAQTRLKSSFIYLANAVNDLRGNWTVLAVVIAPLALALALCVLPYAFWLQNRVVKTFDGSSGQTVSFMRAQIPGHPPERAPDSGGDEPVWLSFTVNPISILLALALKLVVLCTMERIHRKTRAPDAFSEGIAIYRRAIKLAPAFGLIALMQWLATAVGVVLLVVPGILTYVWLYFAQYSLVFDDRHSWPALLFSRELMRGRFFKVATRIVVFLAVWSGYNSWAASIFVVTSLLLERIAMYTDLVAVTVFTVSLFAVSVTFATVAFFVAAGVRLYQDLCAIATEEAHAKVERQGTVPLHSPAL